MAGTEQLDVSFHGVGGQGASPQFTKDPILMGVYTITEYQAILSRVLDPREMCVITVGAFLSGVENDVIPEEATLRLNFRFFDERDHEKLFKGTESISNGIARIFGMPEDKLPTIVKNGSSTTLINDSPLMDRLNGALIESGVVSEKTLTTRFTPVTGSENAQMFVHGLDDEKMDYDFIGTADPKQVAAAKAKGQEVPFANHNPNYQVDLNAIVFGAKVAAIMTMDLLAKGSH